MATPPPCWDPVKKAGKEECDNDDDHDDDNDDDNDDDGDGDNDDDGDDDDGNGNDVEKMLCCGKLVINNILKYFKFMEKKILSNVINAHPSI